MIKENLYFGAEAKAKLMQGVSKVAQAVGVTLGTSGSNSLIECIESPGHYSTNDGYSIANSIYLEDPLENMGRKVLLEAINRANKSSGDGSSTTCVLTQAILEEGMKHIGEVSPMEIKRSLEACIPLIEASIKSQKKEITVDTIAQVASISAEDEGIGNRIQEIYQKIGKDGVISWDVSKTPEDSYSIGTGLTVHGATYLSRYMCDTESSGFTTKVNLTNPLILLARRKITSITDLDGITKSLFNEGIHELVVFCEDMDAAVVNGLVYARQQLGFRTVVIKMPVLWKDEWWEDLSVASGAKIIDAISGTKMYQVTKDHLGTFEHITIDKEDTYIDGIKDMSKHILGLQVDGTDQALQRATRLNTRTARYFVGAHSESALAYRRLKVEDAINAASCALDNGVVAGGGVALRDIAKMEGIGGKILIKALVAPYRTICSNAGIEPANYPKDWGIDTKTSQSVDMFEAGIVDPTDVVLNAVRNAIGVAASILTIGTVVTLPRDDQPIQQPTR